MSLIGGLVALGLVVWWIKGSPWPILPVWLMFVALFGFAFRDEGHWNWVHDWPIPCLILLVAMMPCSLRLQRREKLLQKVERFAGGPIKG